MVLADLPMAAAMARTPLPCAAHADDLDPLVQIQIPSVDPSRFVHAARYQSVHGRPPVSACGVGPAVAHAFPVR